MFAFKKDTFLLCLAKEAVQGGNSCNLEEHGVSQLLVKLTITITGCYPEEEFFVVVFFGMTYVSQGIGYSSTYSTPQTWPFLDRGQAGGAALPGATGQPPETALKGSGGQASEYSGPGASLPRDGREQVEGKGGMVLSEVLG